MLTLIYSNVKAVLFQKIRKYRVVMNATIALVINMSQYIQLRLIPTNLQ